MTLVPPTPNVSIAFKPAPPVSIPIIGTATFAAVVSNDPSHAGVDWFLNCNTTDCGSLSATTVSGSGKSLHTASGIKVTYKPPATLITNSQPVFITAFATADDTKNVLATMTVMGFTGILKGNYVFEVRGNEPAAVIPYRLAGVLVADGNGNITGEQTSTSYQVSISNTQVTGSYAINADGTGTIIINTGISALGNNGTENFSIVVLSSSQVLISEVDLNTPPGQTSSGIMDLQTSVAPLSGGYAFVVGGTTVALDPSGNLLPNALAYGGVFNVDSPGRISGTGSVADEDIGNSSTGGTVLNSQTLSGTVSAPDKLGAVTINLSVGFTPSPIQLTGYIVDSTHVKLAESDNGSGTGFGATSGVAIGQGAATGSFASSSQPFPGTFVYGMLGQVAPIPYWATFSLAGLFTAVGSGNLAGNLSGVADENILGTPVYDTLTGTYTIDSSGTGRVTTSNMAFGTSGPGPTLLFYLTGNGNAPLVLDTDVSTLGAGITYAQAGGQVSLDGAYAFNLTRFDPIAFAETDGIGGFTVNGVAGTLAGSETIVNTTIGQGGTLLTLGGTFTSSPNGRFTATINESTGGSVTATSSVALYMIDSNHGLFTENDSTFVSLGYFATQMPACSGCSTVGQSSGRESGREVQSFSSRRKKERGDLRLSK